MPVLKYVDGAWTTHGGPEGQRGLPGLQGAQGPVNPLNVGRNRLINGDFSVNQRQTTTVSVSGGYGHDRWQLGFVGNSFYHAHFTESFGVLPESYTSKAQVISASQTLPSSYCVLYQILEGVRTLSGKTVTFSFWASTLGSPYNVALEFIQSFGLGGSPSAPQYATSAPITISGSAWKRYSITMDLPSLAGKTMGTSGDYVVCHLWISAGSDYAVRSGGIGLQATTGNYWGFQLEEGPVATLFETKTYDEQLRACQRYFQRWRQPPLRGQAGATEYCTRMSMPLPVQMYKVPTAIVGGAMYVWDGIQGTSFTSISENLSTTQTLEVQMHTAAAVFSAGRPITLYQENAGNGYLDITAELP